MLNITLYHLFLITQAMFISHRFAELLLYLRQFLIK